MYGANDGLITTFAIVTGVTGASLSPRLIVILGLANLFADGLSMGASNYLAIRSDNGARAAEGRGGHEPFPARHAMATFVAFVVIGAVPIVSYLFMSGDEAFTTTIVLTLVTLFAVGATRSTVTGEGWFRNGVEMLIVGTAAAAVAYGVGAWAAQFGS